MYFKFTYLILIFGFTTIQKDLSMIRNKKEYIYVFSNGFSRQMTPVEAHNYAYKHKVDIKSGPNYVEGKRQKSFDGFGWHDSLQMSFRGPRHYREYLRANNIEEAGLNDCPKYTEETPPLWTEELIRKAVNVHGIEIGSVMAEALLSGELAFPEA